MDGTRGRGPKGRRREEERKGVGRWRDGRERKEMKSMIDVEVRVAAFIVQVGPLAAAYLAKGQHANEVNTPTPTNQL